MGRQIFEFVEVDASGCISCNACYATPEHRCGFRGHMPTADDNNELVFVERTGHTYQMKEQEVADVLLKAVSRWKEGH